MRQFAVAELAQSCGNVPTVPGVYVFRAADQRALYVGKSKNLRARLASYFQPGAREVRKARALQRFAVHVEVELTGSEFAALLREVELVQTLAPPYNQRLRHPERYAYIGIDYRDPYPRLTVTTAPADGSQFLGPFANVRRVKAAIEVLADVFHLRTCDGVITPDPQGAACFRHQVKTCSAPCLGAINAGAYGRELLQAILALSGRSWTSRSAWTAQRDQLAAAQRFETAERRQRQVAALDRVRRNLFISQRVWHDALVVQPAASAGRIDLWGIAAGAVRQRLTCSTADLRTSFERLWQAVEADHAGDDGRLIAQTELDGRWIVHRWLTSPEGERWSIRLGDLDRSTAWQRLTNLATDASSTLFPA